MSARRAVYLMCDICEAVTDVDTMGTAADVRRYESWDRRDGKDICRACQVAERETRRKIVPE